jgi:hypothetical protein
VGIYRCGSLFNILRGRGRGSDKKKDPKKRLFFFEGYVFVDFDGMEMR